MEAERAYEIAQKERAEALAAEQQAIQLEQEAAALAEAERVRLE